MIERFRPKGLVAKGVVENIDRRVRRFPPREIDMRQFIDADIRAVTDRMTATPASVLDEERPQRSAHRR